MLDQIIKEFAPVLSKIAKYAVLVFLVIVFLASFSAEYVAHLLGI